MKIYTNKRLDIVQPLELLPHIELCQLPSKKRLVAPVVYLSWPLRESDFELVRALGASKVIVDHSWEGGIDLRQWARCCSSLEQMGVPFNSQLYVLNTDCGWQFKQLKKHNCFFYDFFLADIASKLSKRIGPISSRPVQGLCMIGKLYHRPFRIKQMWSFFNNHSLRDRLISSTLESNYSSDLANSYSAEFAEWCRKPRLNKVRLEHTSDGASCWGWPAPWKAYRNTRASFIMETLSPEQHGTFTTEKTYRTIHCGHSFVLSSPPEVRQQLLKYGFRLFESVVPSDYDATNFDAMTDLFNTLIDGAEHVQADVDYNRDRLKKLAVLEKIKLYHGVNDFLKR